MGRYLVLEVLLAISTQSSSQTFRPDMGVESTSTIKPTQLFDTIVVTKLNKQQVYSNALNYIFNAFYDSRDVIEMKDPDIVKLYF